MVWTQMWKLFQRVPLVGAAGPPPLRPMRGVHLCTPPVVTVAIRQATSVLGLHRVKVAPDHRLQEVTGLLILLMHGAQILGHLQLLEHCHPVRHH